jgi:hypothetical protein
MNEEKVLGITKSMAFIINAEEFPCYSVWDRNPFEGFGLMSG